MTRTKEAFTLFALGHNSMNHIHLIIKLWKKS